MTIQELMNNNWNTDLELASKWIEVIKTKTIKGVKKEITVKQPVEIWVTDGDIVTISYYVQEGDRWNMFTKNSPPIAWQAYIIPKYKGG